ncbi:MAG: hypothetical protein COW63_12030 [Bacteroidetes bacterium CG18_big_fil_WC_8_21_14_2_50_41_14]|nr:MAG: hypothetical protein COW63_12030 [Bacteroidetes bacterium CG18_big_fil_WC_8_21_14_2_50_41_14]PJB56935.1 MAG: hypothetical protein CO098_12645 [Bacteroidetes bacterium CG_4_9_14_3_um_filter_41_19]
MKKIIMFLSVILFLSIGTNAQTLSTTTTQPAVGPIDVPVNIAGIGTIYTLTVYFTYDNSVLTYTGFTNAADPNVTITNQTPNTLKILVGNFPNTTTLADGKLLDLQFGYVGGYSDLVFGASSSTYKSSILTTAFSTWLFPPSNVTNGAVQGYYDNTISGGAWGTAANWTALKVPNAWANVFVASGSETTIALAALANNLTINQGGKLSLNGTTLDVSGYFLIESNATGNGSFINNGTLNVTGTTSVESYVTAGQWHGISAPVTGLTALDLYLGGAPDVWMKSYNEVDDSYTYASDFGTPLGDMKGWMMWIGGAVPNTYTFSGSLRTGPESSAVTKNGNGYNFVGNPFSSAIDWLAGSGWTKTNVNNAIFVYNGTSFASFVGGVGTNGGSRYIAMNQGFFVEASAAGTLAMTNAVCVHNSVGFMKDQMEIGQIVRLQVEDAGLIDEAVIHFTEGATVDYDGEFDAHKFFSYTPGFPQLYSTANDFMAINSLPSEYRESIPMDVRGANGNELTISATETGGFDKLYLKDESTGNVVNLKDESYSFTYDDAITDRFTILFSITDVEENPLSADARIFASDRTIQVVLQGMDQANISVYNLLGQVIDSRMNSGTVTRIPVQQSGYYLIKVSNGTQVSTQKVFIK